jgi:hypothetical protein
MCITGKAGTKIKRRLEFLEGWLSLLIVRVGSDNQFMIIICTKYKFE